MRIIHISDLHLNRSLKRKNIGRTKKLLHFISSQTFDHLVITGDITDNADDKSFQILRQMLEKFDLLDSQKTSVIIGNHDIFGGVETVHDALEFPKKCKNTNYGKKTVDFVRHFEELFVDCYFPSAKHFFPFVKMIGDTAFIGLNSIDKYSPTQNPFASNGRISKRQRRNLYGVFNSRFMKNKQKVILSHHHFYKKPCEVSVQQNNLWSKIEKMTMILRKRKKLLKFFAENGVNLILHGHFHEYKSYRKKKIELINGGSAIDNKGEPQYIQIDLNDGAVESKVIKLPKNYKTRISENNKLDKASISHINDQITIVK